MTYDDYLHRHANSVRMDQAGRPDNTPEKLEGQSASTLPQQMSVVVLALDVADRPEVLGIAILGYN